MSFIQIIETQRSSVEGTIATLLDRQHTTEQQRDVAPTPKERAMLDLQVSEIRSLIDSYKIELGMLEGELKQLGENDGVHQLSTEPRFPLDYDGSPQSGIDDFRDEVSTTLVLMGYDIEEYQLTGLDSVVLIACQEGDFEDVKGIFHCVPGIIDRQLVTTFNGLFVQLQQELSVRFASLITNSFIAPDARDLVQTLSIQILTFGQLLNKLINFTPYLQKATEKYRSTSPLFRTYVESNYLRTGSGTFDERQIGDAENLVTQGRDSFVAKGDLSTYINIWLRSPTTEHICLLGDYGTGKTSFATHFFYKQATKFLKDPIRERLPILISLSRYHTSADIFQMVTDFLANECSIKRNANMRAFLKMAEAGKLVVILDGFDEMAKQVDRNVRKRNFSEIARILVGRNKVIVSGRPNYFLEEAEIAEILGQTSNDTDPYRAALQFVTSIKSPRYEILNLALFDRWQIEEFLKHQAEFLKQQGITDWRELQNTIYDTYNLEELARTPVLLEIIIKTVSEIKKTVTDINAAKLYEIYTGFWLDREYDEKGEVRWLINRSEKEYFCLELAWQMLSCGESEPAIHYRDLSEKVQIHFNLEKASEIEYFSSDIRFCSFLVHSEADSAYKFIHKSFMEYFAARYLYKTIIVENALEQLRMDATVYPEVCFFLQQLLTSAELKKLTQLAQSESEGFVVDLTLELLQCTSSAAERRGDFADAIEWALEIQRLCTNVRNPSGQLDAMVLEGRLRANCGELEHARTVLLSAVDLGGEKSNQEGQAGALLRLGEVNAQMGVYNEALVSYERASDLLRETGSPLLVQALNATGKAYQAMGDVMSSTKCFEDALKLNRETGDKQNEALTLMELGNSASIIGDLERAMSYFEQSRRIFVETGNRQSEGIVLKSTSSTYYRRGQLAEAEEFLHRSLKIAEYLNNRSEYADTIYRLGVIKVDQQKVDEAQEMFERSLAISQELGNVRQSAVILSSLGDVYFSRKVFFEAEQVYKNALHVFEEIHDISNIGVVNRKLGDLAVERGDFEISRNVYQKAVETFSEIGDQGNLFSSLIALGMLEIKAERFSDAGAWLDRAHKVAEQLSNPYNMCVLHEQLGRLSEGSGNLDTAIREFRRSAEFARKAGIEPSNYVRDKLLKADTLLFENSPKALRSSFAKPVFGRLDVLQRLKREIEQRRSVLLSGQRGMGKTTFLQELEHSVEEPWIAVYTDGQSMFGGGTEAANLILSRIVESLSEAKLISHARIEKTTLSYARDLIRAIRSILSEAQELRPELRLLLIVDEVELLIHQNSTELLSVLRHLVQTEESLVLVLSCARLQSILSQERISPGSPLTNVLIHIHLGPLSTRDTYDFVTTQAAIIDIKFDQDVVNEVFRLSGGQPRLIQIICHILTKKAKEQETSIVKMAVLASARNEIVEETYIMIRSTIDSLSKQQVKWLSCLSSDAKLPKVPRQAIQDLVEQDILQEANGVFEIQSALLKEYLCRVSQ